MEKILKEFIEKITKGEIDLYNEFGIQFELAIYLRGLNEFSDFKIELERPIGHFKIDRTNEIPKKEIDLVIYNENIKYAIEIKFSNNGQVPIQMFKFCEDICFLEHLIKQGFNECYSLILVDRNAFFEKKRISNGIYKYFRDDDVLIKGDIICPTGKEKGKKINIEGAYKPIWNHLREKYHYCLTKIACTQQKY